MLKSVRDECPTTFQSIPVILRETTMTMNVAKSTKIKLKMFLARHPQPPGTSLSARGDHRDVKKTTVPIAGNTLTAYTWPTTKARSA
jgi:hypothetical protein